MSENLIENLLSKSEMLVYEYIKEEAAQVGTIKEPMDSMAKSILSRYEDRIPARTRSTPEGPVEEKSFSEATVHRAIRKLQNEGIIQVKAPRDKALPNEIVFFGMPDENDQMTELVDMSAKITLHLERLQTLFDRTKQENKNLKRDNRNLYREMDGLNDRLKKAQLLNAALQDQLRVVESGNNPFKAGNVISITDLGNGTIGYVVAKHNMISQ